MESLNKEIRKEQSTKEQEYLNKIEILENKLLGSDQCDIVLLQKHNKELEIQLNNLNKMYQNITIKYEDDIKRTNILSKELVGIKEDLINELAELDELRQNIMSNKFKQDKLTVKNGQIEMVMRYKQLDYDYSSPLETAEVLVDKPNSNTNLKNIPRIQRNSRPEFNNFKK
jgi:hypothetical protein